MVATCPIFSAAMTETMVPLEIIAGDVYGSPLTAFLTVMSSSKVTSKRTASVKVAFTMTLESGITNLPSTTGIIMSPAVTERVSRAYVSLGVILSVTVAPSAASTGLAVTVPFSDGSTVIVYVGIFSNTAVITTFLAGIVKEYPPGIAVYGTVPSLMDRDPSLSI